MPYLPIATCEIQGYVYDAKLRLAELADGPLARPGAGDTAARRGGRAARALQPRLLDRRAGRLLRHRPRRRQAPDRLADLEHRAAALDRDRARGARRDRRPPAHVGRGCSRAGASGRCRPTTRASTRSATTSGRSGRTTTRSSPTASPATASATRRTGSRWRCSRRRRSRPTGCPRRSPATRGRSAASPSRTRPPAARRPGRPARRCSWSGRCWGSKPAMVR